MIVSSPLLFQPSIQSVFALELALCRLKRLHYGLLFCSTDYELVEAPIGNISFFCLSVDNHNRLFRQQYSKKNIVLLLLLISKVSKLVVSCWCWKARFR